MSTPVDDIRSEVWREIDEAAEQRRRADCFDSLVDALELCHNRLVIKSATCKNASWKVPDQIAYEAGREALAKARQENQA